MSTKPVWSETRRGGIAETPDWSDTDYAGQYGYEDAGQGERLVRNAAAARRVREAL